MIEGINLPLLLTAAFIAGASPGPATLAIAGTSMTSGRKYGLAVACGIVTGSLIWSVTAAFGLGAIMLANSWLLETVRYIGAGYLIYLAWRSANSALKPGDVELKGVTHSSLKRAYSKGLTLHLTNPKAILYFGSLYAIGIPANTSLAGLAIVIVSLWVLGIFIFLGYAILFSSGPIRRSYFRLRRWFEGVFALAFAAAGLKILTTRFQ
ncbi:MAG: LysE family translocator [Rhizobiaceae bacterium]|nr:LysE family translocator [Rhizobiaceae bacterium]